MGSLRSFFRWRQAGLNELSLVVIAGLEVPVGAPNSAGILSTSEETFISSKPGNELEGLIRDKLPDPVRRHLIDVIIDHIAADG